ncbi:hypothetical protein JYT15_00440 [Acidimicrobium ferrooxidans]|nr:hypothetical protein [Acidimicrobium ferrooxidans]
MASQIVKAHRQTQVGRLAAEGRDSAHIAKKLHLNRRMVQRDLSDLRDLDQGAARAQELNDVVLLPLLDLEEHLSGQLNASESKRERDRVLRDLLKVRLRVSEIRQMRELEAKAAPEDPIEKLRADMRKRGVNLWS